jgi:hypothetical protein
VPSVAGCLLQEVSQDPSQVLDWLIVELGALLVEACGSGYHPIDVAPNLAVANDRRAKRWSVRRVTNFHFSPTKAAKDPRRFCISYMIDEPQERRARTDRREPGLLIVYSRDLPHNGCPLVIKEGEERRTVVVGHPRRLLLGHGKILPHRGHLGSVDVRSPRKRSMSNQTPQPFKGIKGQPRHQQHLSPEPPRNAPTAPSPASAPTPPMPAPTPLNPSRPAIRNTERLRRRLCGWSPHPPAGAPSRFARAPALQSSLFTSPSAAPPFRSGASICLATATRARG